MTFKSSKFEIVKPILSLKFSQSSSESIKQKLHLSVAGENYLDASAVYRDIRKPKVLKYKYVGSFVILRS